MKHIINNILSLSGYQFCKSQNLKTRIKNRHFKWLQDFEIKTVIDIGANYGQFALMINQIIPDADIYSFEPVYDSFKKLTENVKHIRNIKCFNFALGDSNNKSIIYHNEFSASSSLLKIGAVHIKAFPHTKNYFEEEIEVKTFDSLESQILFNPRVLMKIDVQGYELNVLCGAMALLEKVDIIIIETSFYELYEKQPLFNDIYNFLSKRGFFFYGNLEQSIDKYDGKILQADSIFIKK